MKPARQKDGDFDTSLIDFEGGFAQRLAKIWYQKAGLIPVNRKRCQSSSVANL